jgi:beta-galactosidase/beta-glucuronidase
MTSTVSIENLVRAVTQMTSETDIRSTHPRPQLTRPRWSDLSGSWGFAYDDRDVGRDERWFERSEVFDREIQVPFPPESPASGIGDTSFHPVVWYRRTFNDDRRDGERLLLRFGAVDYRASVWVNGQLVATHEGGHTPFFADVTPVLTNGPDQVVVVRAEDPPQDMTQPRGKQDWQARPHSIWYERTTGIWQPVWLEPVPATHIEAVRWTPNLHQRVLGIRIKLNQAKPGLRIRVQLILNGKQLADTTYAADKRTVLHQVPLDGARMVHDRRHYLWSVSHPNLIDATITLLDGDDAVDEVASYTGLREVRATGGRFVLNNRAFFLRMVLAQNYWPESHLAAPSAEAIRREVELVKELGFNGVRIHQKVEDPRFLYWCDVLGVLAWDEMPSTFDYDSDSLNRLTKEWLEVIERDASSPAVVAWVPFNESWGVPELESDRAQQHAVRALYSLTKAIDPTRLVIGNDGWEHLISDIFSIHDYTQSGETLRDRYGSRADAAQTIREVQPLYRTILLSDVPHQDEPLMVTEFGGVTFRPDSDDFWNGYGAVNSADEMVQRYDELVSALLASPVVAGFCYTQLTDTGQERNGLLDENRRPKAELKIIAEINRRQSAAVPADAIAEIQIVHAANRLAAGEDVANTYEPGM